ncbi:type 2 periplasmic-binding domain-containing protein [Corynebacterium comes]|uniref:LysR substrate binding domain protein n=1 Tax=Corynebacterium comes TaxID=2675218 RepID=A0A6B8VRZ7_9CORY|nr:LysR substrate-binding domain-containing protein [Corynebacterium comes]QGU04134.1 LysR substrate binding domain protein [Corynebacterium comes]
MLRLSFATGTEPGKWFTRFRDRTAHGRLLTTDSEDPLAELLDARADLALARLPDPRVTGDYHVVELYRESPGIALPKDSELTLLDRVSSADIEGEIVNWRTPADGLIDIPAVREGLQVVAANVGVVIAPRPLIRVLSRKQIEHRDFVGDVPATHIALVWRKTDDSGGIQDFVGIAKGRTPNSSRQVAPKRSAREKALAKQERRAGAAGVEKRARKTRRR